MDDFLQTSKTRLVIFGLDGCVSNNTARHIYKEPEQYHEHCMEDPVFEVAEKLIQFHLSNKDFIVFSTARPFRLHQQTAQWINQKFNIFPRVDFIVFMRGDQDDRPELAIKSEHVQHLLNWTEQTGRRVTMAYDDSDEITRHYLSRGIAAARLEGNSYVQLLTPPPDTAIAPAAPVAPPATGTPLQLPPVVQYPTTEGLPVADGREPAGYNLGAAALFHNMSIQPIDFITANGLTYLEGSIIQLVSTWRQTRNMTALQLSKELVQKLIDTEDKNNGTD